MLSGTASHTGGTVIAGSPANFGKLIADQRRFSDGKYPLSDQPGWGWSFDHQAGQYVGIAVSVDGRFVPIGGAP